MKDKQRGEVFAKGVMHHIIRAKGHSLVAGHVNDSSKECTSWSLC